MPLNVISIYLNFIDSTFTDCKMVKFNLKKIWRLFEDKELGQSMCCQKNLTPLKISCLHIKTDCDSILLFAVLEKLVLIKFIQNNNQLLKKNIKKPVV